MVALEQSILADPDVGDLVPGTGGLRKVRAAQRDARRGKSGGVRVCYLALPRRGEQMDLEERTLLVLRVERGLTWDEIAGVFSEGTSLAAASVQDRFEQLKEKLARTARAYGLVE